MKFFEIVRETITLLEESGRVSYRALKMQFDLDDEQLDALKEELVDIRETAVDKNGKMLVWTGAEPAVMPPDTSATDAATESARPPAAPSRAAERRQLTVMFCDLVNSTALSGRLDPEDLRDVVRDYQQMAAVEVERYEGHIAQYLGDGLLVYFGHPVAHEDDARRAVYAALDIIGALDSLNVQLESTKGVQLAVRVGIHSGLVVVGEMAGGQEHGQLALGDTPNIAARLEGLAEPNTIVISAATARLTRGAFKLDDLGPQSLKGVSESVGAARVAGATSAEAGNESDHRDATQVMVGREEEFRVLLRRWQQSHGGNGQVVVLSGEPGIGKSILVDSLYRSVAADGAIQMTFRCSPYHQNSALYPVIEYLRRVLGFEREDSAEGRLQKLEQLLSGYRSTQQTTVPLFAALFSIQIPENQYAPLKFNPQQQRQYTQEALTAWITEQTEDKAKLVVFEDLHWADASTLEMVGALTEEVPTVRMMLMVTGRPEFIIPWPSRSHQTALTLNRLERPQVEALVTHVSGGRSLPAEVVEHIVNKTDGVPLFVEELTKTLLESNILQARNDHFELTGPLATVTIPSTLHDSLMARLDRLPEGKEVAQLGAVLGREFAYEMVKILSTAVEEILQSQLNTLVHAELLYQRGRPPRSKYIFKHALIQDAAYASLLRSARQAYHQAVAQMMEGQFPELVQTQPEIIAHHYTEAAQIQKANPYWLKAGQHAAHRSANVEAINHLTKGLEVIKELPDSSDRARAELALQLALGAPMIMARGSGNLEVENTYLRAQALCQQVGDSVQLARVSFALFGLFTHRAAHDRALEAGQQLLKIGQDSGNPASLLTAHNALGTTFFWLGNFTAAREHLEEALAAFSPDAQAGRVSSSALFAQVATHCYLALTVWSLGYPERANQEIQTARQLAAQASRPYARAFAEHYAAALAMYQQQPEALLEHAQAELAVANEFDFPIWKAGGEINRGMALVSLGQHDDGITQLRRGIVAWRDLSAGVTAGLPMFLGWLASAAGSTTEALNCMEEAASLIESTNERQHEAELHRLRGQRAATEPNGSGETDSEMHFRRALEIANQQQAKSLELRAATDLARLWQQQGKSNDAYDLLAKVVDWFSEGSDSPDQQRANTLLRELKRN